MELYVLELQGKYDTVHPLTCNGLPSAANLLLQQQLLLRQQQPLCDPGTVACRGVSFRA